MGMGFRGAASNVEFWEIARRVRGLIDTSSRFPAWPFYERRGFVSIYEHDCVIGGYFGEVLEGLAQTYGDESVDVVIFDPGMNYFRDVMNIYPGFVVDAGSLDEGYCEGIGADPCSGEDRDLCTFGDDIGIVGSSGKWAVWSQRDWEIGLLIAPDETGPWLSAKEKAHHRSIDLDDILAPRGPWRVASDDEMKVLSDNISKFGSGL